MKKRLQQCRVKIWPVACRAQRGAALVVALIILLLVSILSVTGANQALLGEKMASNQYTQTKAFLAAEAGVSQALKTANNSAAAIAQAIASGDTKTINDTWGALISSGWQPVDSNSSANPLTVAQYRLSAAVDNANCPYTPSSGNQCWWLPAKDILQVKSQGRMANGATRKLVVEIKPAQQGEPPFSAGLVGREGVSITAGSKIDTYDSRLGGYGELVTDASGNTYTNSNSSQDGGAYLQSAVTKTCTADSTTMLSGYSPVYGDVLAVGDLIGNGQSPVHGNIHANGAIDLALTVDGNVTSGGNLTIESGASIGKTTLVGGDLYDGGATSGKVYVYGNANFSTSSSTNMSVAAGGDVYVDNSARPPPSILAGGQITGPVSKSTYKSGATTLGLPSISPVPADQPECSQHPETLLSQKFSKAQNDPENKLLSTWLSDKGCSEGSCFTENGTTFSMIGQGNGGNNTLTLGAKGVKTVLTVNSNLTTTGNLGTLLVKGFVTLVVKGNLSLGDRTTLDITPQSALTVLVTGRVTFSNGSTMKVEGLGTQGEGFVRENDGNPIPAFSVYSSYQGGGSGSPGIDISGYNDTYGAIYAPLTNVSVGGSGDLYGSVVARTVNISGSGQIHYDEALGTVHVGSGSSSTAAKLISWQQIQG